MAKANSIVWGIHAGRTGDADDLFQKHNVIALGWPKAGDISKLAADREAFKAHLKKVYPEEKQGWYPVAAGQLFRFLHEIKLGDYVGRLQLNVLMAVAEFEREIIRERVNAGLAAARARGVKLGRRAKHNRTAAEVNALKLRGLGVRAIARELKIPVSSAWVMLRAEPQTEAV